MLRRTCKQTPRAPSKASASRCSCLHLLSFTLYVYKHYSPWTFGNRAPANLFLYMPTNHIKIHTMELLHRVVSRELCSERSLQAAGRAGACAAGAVPALVALLGSTHAGVQVRQPGVAFSVSGCWPTEGTRLCLII